MNDLVTGTVVLCTGTLHVHWNLLNGTGLTVEIPFEIFLKQKLFYSLEMEKSNIYKNFVLFCRHFDYTKYSSPGILYLKIVRRNQNFDRDG